MNLIRHEMKKIWGLRSLLMVALLCGLYFLMYMDWHVRHSQVATAHDALIVRELAERFGTRLTHGEMEGFFAEAFLESTAKLEYHMARDGDFATRGIFTYVDFIRAELTYVRVTDWDEEMWELLNRMYLPENGRIAGRLMALWQMHDNWSSITAQIGMDLEFERYGFSAWFYETLDAVLVSDNVPGLLAALRQPIEDEADAFIAGYARFGEKGIFTYAQFDDFWVNERGAFISFAHDRARWELWFVLLGPGSGFVGRKIGMLDDLLHMYTYAYSRTLFDWQVEGMVDSYAARMVYMTPFAQRRIEGIYDNQDYLNIMCRMAFNITVGYMWRFVVMAVLGSFVLVMPLLTVDRMRNIKTLQYTSRVGRYILKRQLVAAVLSSVVLTTLLLAVFGGLYFRETGVLRFWGHGVFSFTNPNILLFDFTFGQYLLILTAFAYAAALTAALLATVAAHFSRTLIAATIKVIPLFAGLVFILHYTGTAFPFSALHRFYMRTNIVGGETIVAVFLLAIAFCLMAWIIHREKRKDLL